MGVLKPCPFCGTEAKYGTEEFRHGTTYNIYCETCGAEIARLDENEVIETWNRRIE